MENENEILIYPYQDPDNLGCWEQILRDAQANSLLSEEDLNIILTQGCISVGMLKSIRNKIMSTFLGSTIFTIAWLAKIRKHLNFSQEDWNKYFPAN